MAILITIIFYPGFMSYDTLHALRGARYGVIDSVWPPMVSYIWMFVDFFSEDPSLMHFFQILVLFISINYIFKFYEINSNKKIFILFLVILFIPYLIGTLAVIWKDVLMTSFIFLTLTLLIKFEKSEEYKYLFLSLIFLIISACIRHNAIFAIWPFIIYFSYLFTKKIFFFNKKKFISIIIIFFLTLMGTMKFKNLIDTYSITNRVVMKNSTSNFLKGRMIRDLAGASICLNKNLFKNISYGSQLDDLIESYDPRHTNLSKGIYKAVGRKHLDGIDLRNLWLNTLFNHPICFFKYHFDLTSYLIGMHSGKQFLITHPSVDKNEFGYLLKKSKIRDKYVNYITTSTKTFFFKPFFLYFVFFIILFKQCVKKIYFQKSFYFLIIGSFSYILSFIFLGNAADARLLFFSNLSIYILLSISILNKNKLVIN